MHYISTSNSIFLMDFLSLYLQVSMVYKVFLKMPILEEKERKKKRYLHLKPKNQNATV